MNRQWKAVAWMILSVMVIHQPNSNCQAPQASFRNAEAQRAWNNAFADAHIANVTAFHQNLSYNETPLPPPVRNVREQPATEPVKPALASGQLLRQLIVSYDPDHSAPPGQRKKRAREYMSNIPDANLTLLDTCACGTDGSRLELWGDVPADLDIHNLRQTAQSDLGTDDIDIDIDSELLLEAPDTSGLDQFAILSGLYYRTPHSSARSVRVGLIDTGANLPSDLTPGHPDLQGIVLTNEGEENGNAGQDDDGNCYIDDIEGVNFTGLEHHGNMTDNYGHGTGMAGLIYRNFPHNLKLELLNLKVLEKEMPTNLFDLICAVHHAIDREVEVLNISLGYNSEVPSKALYKALRRSQLADMVVVASAGNDGLDLDNRPGLTRKWPAAFKHKVTRDGGEFGPPIQNMIVVAALNQAGSNLIPQSNYGHRTVDLAAPGSRVRTTGPNSGYIEMSGTSVAAPHVSRVAALIRGLDPAKTYDEIIRCITHRNNVIVEDSLFHKLSSRGKLSAENALMCALGNSDLEADTEANIVVHQNKGSKNLFVRLKYTPQDWHEIKFTEVPPPPEGIPLEYSVLFKTNTLMIKGDQLEAGRTYRIVICNENEVVVGTEEITIDEITASN